MVSSLWGHAGEAAEPAWSPEWKKITPSPFSRTEAATAVADGKLYLLGGFIERLETSNQVDVYDPSTGKWSRKKEMPTRPAHVNPAVNGHIVWLAGAFNANILAPPARKFGNTTRSQMPGPLERRFPNRVLAADWRSQRVDCIISVAT